MLANTGVLLGDIPSADFLYTDVPSPEMHCRAPFVRARFLRSHKAWPLNSFTSFLTQSYAGLGTLDVTLTLLAMPLHVKAITFS